MPRSKQTQESRVLAFFQEAPLEAAQLLLGLAKAEVARRQPPAPAKTKKRGRPPGTRLPSATPEQRAGARDTLASELNSQD